MFYSCISLSFLKISSQIFCSSANDGGSYRSTVTAWAKELKKALHEHGMMSNLLLYIYLLVHNACLQCIQLRVKGSAVGYQTLIDFDFWKMSLKDYGQLITKHNHLRFEVQSEKLTSMLPIILHYKIQLANNKIQMAWLTSWLVVG